MTTSLTISNTHSHKNGSDSKIDKNTYADICEHYEGHYRFAPIEEAQVSRAMIKRLVSFIITVRFTRNLLSYRYFEAMYERAISDVVIIGAGSAGLSCAYQLAKSAPHLKITILEAGVAPGGGGCSYP